jgi:uncharacterized phiE125 gp8 family phage protein
MTRVSALDGEAILPLADAKAHLRVKHTSEDALIAALRDAAVSHVERLSGIALAPGTWRWTMREFSGRVSLPIGPVTGLGDVKYFDADGTEQTYAGARLVDGSALPAANGSWPAAYGYAAVEFTAGLETADQAPELVAAAKLMLGHLYANAEAVSDRGLQEVPLGVSALIDTYRQVLV